MTNNQAGDGAPTLVCGMGGAHAELRGLQSGLPDANRAMVERA